MAIGSLVKGAIKGAKTLPSEVSSFKQVDEISEASDDVFKKALREAGETEQPRAAPLPTPDVEELEGASEEDFVWALKSFKAQQRAEEGTLWSNKTGMPFTDDQLTKTAEGRNPRNITEVVEMDIDELIDEHARILSEATGDTRQEIIQSRLDDTEVMNELRDVFVHQGNMNMPALWKPGAVGATEGQEGLHRALVAKELGIRKVPVAVVQKAKREELDKLPLPDVEEQ